METDHPRTRRKRSQFTYEAEDEPVENAKAKLKMNMYFAVLDTAIQSLEERFSRDVSSVFGVLYDVHGL